MPSAVALNAAERELIRKLLAFPGEVREAVDRRAPHRIASYALELGQAFAAFYRDSPVLKEPDATLQAFRIALCVAHERTLAAALGSARRLGAGVHVMLDRPRHQPARDAAALHPRRQPRAWSLCNGPQCVSDRRVAAARRARIRSRSSPPRSGATRTPGAAPGRRLHRRRQVVLYAGDATTVALGDHQRGGLRRAARARSRRDEAAARRVLALLCVRRRRRSGRGEAADALLAADRLRAVRPPVDDGPAQARRRPGAGRARLRARLQGAGAGRQQGPGRQAAAGVRR